MNKIYLKIAQCVIEVKAKMNLNNFYLREFKIPKKKPNYRIILTDNTIQNEILLKRTVTLPEKIHVHKLQYVIREILQDYFGKKHNGFILHCSSVAANKNAYLFAGPNGSGKSTISEILGEQYQKIADDSGIVVWDKKHKYFIFFQTPFIEKHPFEKSTIGFRIKGVFFITKSHTTKEKHITDRARKIMRIHKQIFTDQKRRDIQLPLLFNFTNPTTPFYMLEFTKKRGDLLGWFSRFIENSL